MAEWLVLCVLSTGLFFSDIMRIGHHRTRIFSDIFYTRLRGPMIWWMEYERTFDLMLNESVHYTHALHRCTQSFRTPNNLIYISFSLWALIPDIRHEWSENLWQKQNAKTSQLNYKAKGVNAERLLLFRNSEWCFADFIFLLFCIFSFLANEKRKNILLNKIRFIILPLIARR